MGTSVFSSTGLVSIVSLSPIDVTQLAAELSEIAIAIGTMSMINKLSQLRLRMATLNVHFFTDFRGRSNVYPLVDVLKPLSLDVIAVQEAFHTDQPPGRGPMAHHFLTLLAKLLDIPHIAFGSTVREYGNGVLSRFPLKSSTSYRSEKLDGQNVRGMLAVKVDHDFFHEHQATLYVTHLDQISETTRLTQWDSFEKRMDSSDRLRLIMGDFNALTIGDYSDEYFRKNIRDVRKQNDWESPQDALTTKIKASGYHDCWREMNKDTIDEPAVTCAYGTRIDYIWRRGELAHGWSANECQIFPSENATDHNGVLITFAKSTA